MGEKKAGDNSAESQDHREMMPDAERLAQVILVPDNETRLRDYGLVSSCDSSAHQAVEGYSLVFY